MTGRTGQFISTYQGVEFYPFDPRLEDIHTEDIAHALSNQCRFTGHCNSFYSVAEHSLNVAWVIEYEEGDAADPEVVMRGLLHDAAEAYLTDLARPIKHMKEMRLYRDAEKRIEAAIFERFHLPVDDGVADAVVKRADNIMLGIEARDLMSKLGPAWDKWLNGIPSAFPLCMTGTMTPPEAERAFLKKFREMEWA